MVVDALVPCRFKSRYVILVFFTVHGLNEGHIAPYTDFKFQLAKYQTYIMMKSQDKLSRVHTHDIDYAE